jgi:putative protease
VGNPLAIGVLADLGFTGAIVSPELGEKEMLSLPGKSCLPLGILISGLFPLCISRVLGENVQTEESFSSPHQEDAWVKRHGGDFWLYPNWRLDLTKKRKALQAVGYQLFVHMKEPIPKGVEMKKRPGLWNWAVGLR